MRGAASASISQTNETGSARAATTRFARDSSADTPTAIAVAGTWVRVGTVVTVAAAASTRILRRLADSKRATSRASKTPAAGIATIRSAQKTTARATTATTADSARATSGRSRIAKDSRADTTGAIAKDGTASVQALAPGR